MYELDDFLIFQCIEEIYPDELAPCPFCGQPKVGDKVCCYHEKELYDDVVPVDWVEQIRDSVSNPEIGEENNHE